MLCNFMKLQPASNNQKNIFTAYGEGYVEIKAQRFSTNLILLPEQLITGWTAHRFAELTMQDMQALAALEAEIILLGTGQQLRFPPPELMQPFMQIRKGLEVMDLSAACRTYNILLDEGRKVAAALLFD